MLDVFQLSEILFYFFITTMVSVPSSGVPSASSPVTVNPAYDKYQIISLNERELLLQIISEPHQHIS